MLAASLSPRRSQSSPSSKVCATHNHSDPSCSHASALARSLLAIATTNLAAKSEEDDSWESGQEPPQFQLNREPTLSKFLASPQSPFPSSAFSDYGSSECSSAAYTPSDSDDSDDDPFEFDNGSHQPSTTTKQPPPPPPLPPPPPPPDNFRLFAAAIQMNSLTYDFVLPSFPPQKLVERRPNRFGGDDATQSAVASPAAAADPFAASFANELRLPTPSSRPPSPSQQEVLPSSSSSDPTMYNTLAARRRRPDTDVFLLRSNSFAGVPDSRQTPRAVPILRRINTDDANLGRVSKSTSAGPTPDDTWPDTSITVRPRRRSSSAGPRPLSEILRAGPLTPISPPSPEDEAASQPLAPPSEPQSKPQQTHEMSPPTTPQMPATAPDDASMLRRLVWYPNNCSSSDDDGSAFAFDFYSPPLPSAGPAALLTTASIASSTTCGDRAFF